MSERLTGRLLAALLLLMLPIVWLAAKFDPYQVDGDAVNYMDIASYLHAHNWHAVVNSYWHPGYPALLALGQIVFHPTRANELGAYYAVNYGVFLLEAAAMWWFITALVRLRERMASGSADILGGLPLLSLNSLRMLGIASLLIATQRELSLGKIRPDALLQALLLAALAAVMSTLASDSILLTPLIGVFFGLAYLTKSFAFAVCLLSVIVMLVAGLWLQRRTLRWAAVAAVLAVLPFVLIAGPYVSALSHKFHRLDFGDSGALNFAWYSSNTEKMHLEPWMTDEFGSAKVTLQHPEQQLLKAPGVYSYKAVPYGTYPDWYDTAWFNERVVPKTNIPLLVKRDARNVALIVRYVFNHPEAWVLFALLLLTGARVRLRGWQRNGFWLPMVFLGLAMWGIYGLVNIEERYVTLAYLVVLLPIFAMLRAPGESAEAVTWKRNTAAAMVAMLAFLSLGESLRLALEARRGEASGAPAWHDAAIYGVADQLAALGVVPGDEIACMGGKACLNDYYWARLAGVRITSEIYAPEGGHLLESWEDLPVDQRTAAVTALKASGARALVTYFAPSDQARLSAESQGWTPLGETGYWAMIFREGWKPSMAVASRPWIAHADGNQ
ncbi:MAG: hypothetical protein PW792_17150 [Acidobacteriaceae bacterium]|nr:hypothetical protein [Acidobacteriaceae bacterium]